MKRVLAAVLVFVLLSGGVAFRTLRQFDKTVRSGLIARVSEKTGKEATVDGDVKSSFFFSPSVQIGGVNIPFSCGENLCVLKIGLLTAKLKMIPLLSRRAEIKSLTAKNVSVDVGDKDGLVRAETAEVLVNKDKITVQTQGSFAERTFTLMAGAEKKASDAYAFAFKTDGADFSVQATGNIAEPFSAKRGNADVLMTLSKASLLNEITGYRFPALENVSVKAKVDFDAGKTIVPDFEIKAGTDVTALVRAKGSASFSPLSARFRAALNAPDMSAVAGLPPMPKTTFSADVELNDGFVLDDLKLTVGDSDLSGRVFRQTGKDIRIGVVLRSGRLRMADVGEKILYPLAAVLPSFGKEGGKLFSAESFPFEKLKAAVIDLDVSTDHFVGADGTDLGKTEMKAQMRGGVFSLPDFRLADYVRGQVLFDASKQPADLKIALKAEKFPMALFFAQDGVERGTLSGSAALTGRGDSEAQTAASLNGRIFADMRDLYLKSVQFLPPELSFLSSADANQPLDVQCAVVNVPVQNGVLSSRDKIAAESNVFDLRLNGDANLADETLKMKLDFSPRSDGVLKSLISSADVGGTLARPKISLNAEKVLDSALLVGMAFFRGGKDAVREMVQQEKLKNVCAAALAEEQ